MDDNGRQAIYSTVTKNESSHGFAFVVDQQNGQVVMAFHGEPVSFWTNAVLEKRLIEKHFETVFVAAHTQGKGKAEQFHYYGVNGCRLPSVEKFLKLIEEGGDAGITDARQAFRRCPRSWIRISHKAKSHPRLVSQLASGPPRQV